MDPISASCYSLHIEENATGRKMSTGVVKQDELFAEMMVSNHSLSRFEGRDFKAILPQIIASAIASSFHIVVGLALAYSAILVPQLEDENSELHATKVQTTWITSVIVIAVPVGAIIGGFVMDIKGRLNTIRFAALPAVLGWSLIAIADSLDMLIAGRVLTGLAAAWFSSPAIVYITEIARPDIRGSLIASAPAFASLGMVLAYLKGWFFSWRTTAWLCNIYVIASTVLIMFVHESPAWLVAKGRVDEARRSLEWINKYQPQPADEKQRTLSEMQLDLLVAERLRNAEETSGPANGALRTLRAICRPTGIKPLLVLAGLFFFQNFSGIYVTLFYSVTFFVEMGASVNPYMASVLIGVVRFVMSIVNTMLLKRYGRRPLVMLSCIGMAMCMCLCGLFTYLIKQGTTTLKWVPVLFLLLYVLMSMVGMLPVPWTMTAELFPLEIRGICHSIAFSIGNVLMFMALLSYRPLDSVLGGAYGVQWFYAAVALVGVIYAFVFLPETHGRKLADIQTYFERNTIFLGQQRIRPKAKAAIVRKHHSTNGVAEGRDHAVTMHLIEDNKAAP